MTKRPQALRLCLCHQLAHRVAAFVAFHFEQFCFARINALLDELQNLIAQRLNVFSSYTYTLETIIQAGHSNIRVLSVPIRTNPDLRPSRLVKSIGRYVWRSSTTIVRIFATYKPLTFFWLIALFFLLLGALSGGWYLVYKLMGQGAGHIQSAVLAAASVTVGRVPPWP